MILTERPDLMFEGMTIAGYALGAQQGIVYLRGEYEYLRTFLEHVLPIAAHSICWEKISSARKGSISTSASRWAPGPTSAARKLL